MLLTFGRLVDPSACRVATGTKTVARAQSCYRGTDCLGPALGVGQRLLCWPLAPPNRDHHSSTLQRTGLLFVHAANSVSQSRSFRLQFIPCDVNHSAAGRLQSAAQLLKSLCRPNQCNISTMQSWDSCSFISRAEVDRNLRIDCAHPAAGFSAVGTTAGKTTCKVCTSRVR
jgi:hypothetical protein